MRRDRRTREQRKADASARIAAVCLFLAVLLILFAALTVKTTGQPYKGEPPVTIISDVCRGSAEIAGLRFERDCAEVFYKSAQEAVNSMKLQLRLLDNQLEREWGGVKNA